MRIAVLVLCAVLPAAAGAASAMKPGLWEMSVKSDAMRDMPKLPPEHVEEMRKRGIEVPTVRDGAMVQRVCITPEMVKSNQTPDMGPQSSDCKVANRKQDGDRYEVTLECDGPTVKGRSVVKGRMTGDRFTSTYDFKGSAHGQPMNQHHENSGKWLSADCGNVKPMFRGGAGKPKKK